MAARTVHSGARVDEVHQLAEAVAENAVRFCLGKSGASCCTTLGSCFTYDRLHHGAGQVMPVLLCTAMYLLKNLLFFYHNHVCLGFA